MDSKLLISCIAIHCDICGIRALDDQTFTQERIPFRRAKTYCPHCHALFYERVYIFLLVGGLGIALSSILFAFSQERPLLNSFGIFLLLIFLVQWILIILHELGHAMAARFLGFSQIRILIGYGRALLHFRLFGFPWLINRIPIGGLAYATPAPSLLTRGKWILFVSGGLIVNAFVFIGSWLMIPQGALTDGQRSPLEVLFWANLLVIAENLAPRIVQTPLGPLATDGKLLFDALFYWNKPHPAAGGRIPRWSFWTARLLKVLIVLFLAACTLALALLAVLILFLKELQGGTPTQVVLSAFLLGLGVILGYYTWRTYDQPVTTNRPPQTTVLQPWLMYMRAKFFSAASRDKILELENALSAGQFEHVLARCGDLLSNHPNDIILLTFSALALDGLHEHARAEDSWNSILNQLERTDIMGYAAAYGEKLLQIMAQGDFERFLASCKSFLALPIPDSRKLLQLDFLACSQLYKDKRERYEFAEFCARKALELAPGNLTLQGTLGGLLVECARFEDAEPLLRACYERSSAHHDRGISGFYLALIAEQKNDLQTADTLARQSIILYSEEWLQRKADALFDRLKVHQSATH